MWHLLTGEYPPAIGGVSDYAWTMAAALASDDAVHVWCPAIGADAPGAPNVTVHPIVRSFSRADLRQLAAELDRHPAPRRLFVQWTPQMFGYRSMNIGFAAWLDARARRHGDLVHLMVHEPFLSWSPRPALAVAATAHRAMLALAARHAAHVWVSTSTWTPLIRPFVPARTPIAWLPVPAPAMPLDAHVGGRRHPAPVVGHFGTHSPLVTPILERALDVVLTRSSARVVLVGSGSEAFRARFVASRPAFADRVEAAGPLPSAQAAAALRACDLVVQPYPDGVTTRRSSALTSLALGLPLVSNTGHLSEPFWMSTGAIALAPGPDGQAIGELAVSLMADADRRGTLASAGRELYDSRFAVRHSVALLTSAEQADRHAA